MFIELNQNNRTKYFDVTYMLHTFDKANLY